MKKRKGFVRETHKKKHREEKKKINIKVNFKKIFFFIFLISLIGYTIYFFVSYTSIRTVDPTLSNGSQYYLLSQTKDSFENTLWVFEKGYGNERKIDKVYVQIYNKDKNKSLLIYIPNWIYSKGLEESFGNAIAVSSFRYAGDFIQEGRGIEYSIWQLNQMLGIKSDSYIWFSTEAMSEYQSIYGEISGSTDSLKDNYNSKDVTEDYLFFNKFVNTYSHIDSYKGASKIKDIDGLIYSDLPFRTVVSHIIETRSLLKNRGVIAIDTSKTEYSIEELSNVGGVVNYFKNNEFDLILRKNIYTLIDRELEKERVRVEVYNGSGVGGAALQFGRKIENSGCDVVRYENAPKVVDKTVVYIVDKESFSNSLEIIDEVLAGTYELIEGRPSFMTTGDIIVVLGQDIKLMYSF